MDTGIWEVCYFLENLSKKQGLINQVEDNHLPLNHSGNSWKVISERKKVIWHQGFLLCHRLCSLVSADVKGEEQQGVLGAPPQADHKGKEAVCQDLSSTSVD